MAPEAEAEKAAAAAAAADLGLRLGMSPATPDIVRKPARLCLTTGADGSCCSALSTAAPAPLETDCFGFGSLHLLCGEQSQSVPEDLAGVDCAVSTQESGTLPAQPDESLGKIEQQQERVHNDSDAGGVGPVPTPDKVEPNPWRSRKRSTKGMPRLKVMKDKIMKPKVTPKESSPDNLKKKKNRVQVDASENVGTGSANIARRKLDLDSYESKACFSRATLMGNLRCLAKSRGLQDGKRGKKRKFMVLKHQESGGLAIVPYKRTKAYGSSSALVPFADFAQLDISIKRWKKLKTKVLGLDEETLQIWEVLRKCDENYSESYEGIDIGTGPTWDERRRRIERWVDIFVDAVYSLMGPRKFSQWGGSVIDSVVGTFLTQNVADHLSSNAFMELAAKFPPSKRCHKAEECSNVPPLVDSGDKNLNLDEASGIVDSFGSEFNKNAYSEKEAGYDKEVKRQYGQEYKTIIENFLSNMKQKDISTWNDELMNLVKDKSGHPVVTEITLKKFIATLQPKNTSHWDKLREEAYRNGYTERSGSATNDAVDWESVQRASIVELANCIEVRGQHYVMACRIQAFLTRVKKDHGSFDLDWLRYVPRERAKNYLLSILGLGDKSVDCIRLLSLRHKAFPVDVNVARIVTRLGWVELQPLDGFEFHLVDLYPVMRDVQRYLWPRLCTMDKEKLYELHCLMITFGKVMCTKRNPNCSACPLRERCKYYNTSLKRLSLPSVADNELERSKEQTSVVSSGRLALTNGICPTSFQQMCQSEIRTAEKEPVRNCEPIIEVPPSPEYEYEEALNEQEEPYEDDDLCDLEDIIPERAQYDVEIDLTSSKHVVNTGCWAPNNGEDLVLTNPQCSVGWNKKLKNIGRIRTEHEAYVLPDGHVILEEFEERVPEDPCPYLLVLISSVGKYTVKGTILGVYILLLRLLKPLAYMNKQIPCRTANGGKFPLNGTYFQQNEVFADYSSSHSPISVPRECLWALERRTVYFSSSIHSITKGQTKEDIKQCFMEGDISAYGHLTGIQETGSLYVAHYMPPKKRKKAAKKLNKRARTSPEGKNNEMASPAN
ncbi:hypothetical protein ACP70R_027088 [Stipagrostis hirtigluma subsp. patula]